MTNDHYFTCPRCGGHYFGSTVEIVDGDIVVKSVHCHGDSSGGRYQCDWSGVWPPERQQKDQGKVEVTR